MKNTVIKQFTLAVFILVSFSLTAQNTLYVNHNSGNQNTYPLGNVKKLTFDSGNLLVHQMIGPVQSYNLDDISYLSFQDFVGMDEKEITASNLSVFPNPVNNQLNLQLKSNNSENIDIQLISVNGSFIKHTQKSVVKGENSLSLDISTLESGVYFGRIQTGEAVEYFKFVKQ